MSQARALVGMILLVMLFSLPASPQAVFAMDTEGNPVSSDYKTHYFVFEYFANGTIQPDSYQLVEMSLPLQSIAEDRLEALLGQPGRNQTRLVVLLMDGEGKTIFQDVVDFSPWVRGEFESSSGEGIDGHLVEPQSRAFVVRLPYTDEGRLVLQDSWHVTLAEFDLDRLIAEIPHVRPDEYPMVVDQRILSGSPANRVDLVIMGDGYTAAQEAEFMADAQGVASDFFSISPLAEYANYYNLYLLAAASPQAGADHPPYNAQCDYWDPGCCGDPEMLGDPLMGQMVETAFDSRFCANWIHRLLVADDNKVMEAAGAVPDWDQILVIVNDETYGGSGGTLAVVSMHSSAVSIAQHEYGHSFANLADEYDSPYPGYPPCSDDPELYLPPCEANVTDITVREQIKWSPWILDDTPIPTPNDWQYYGLVGLFEGARYQLTGMYRPGMLCIMRALGYPFCQVPSQAYVLRLYEGGWGVPYDGISLIEPGTTQPVSPTISLTHPAVQVFSAEILAPEGGPPVEINWLDNGVPIEGADTPVFTYATSANDAGLHSITLHVKDATALVNPQMEDGLLQSQNTWMVEVSVPMSLTISANPSIIMANGVSTATITATVMSVDGPVAGDVVTFTTDLGDVTPVTVTTDISGTAATVLTAGWQAGIATVNVELHGYSISVEVEFISGQKFFLPLVNRR